MSADDVDERPTASIGDAPTAAPRIEVGAVLGGKYRLERIIGQGGMGVVYEARNLDLDAPVAVKIVTCASSEATARMEREARLAASIESDHVTRVFDVGNHQGSTYVVMERLEGRNLAALLRDRGRPPPFDEALGYVLDAVEGLCAAHARGVVHRDLKPSNLFLARRDDGNIVLKILDFGVAKSLHEEAADGAMTATNTVLGSPFYMAPEQVRSSRDVNERADVWSLGATLYELACGEPPFTAETTAGVLAMVVADPVVPLRMRAPGVPPRIERIVMRCLAKDPGQRYANAQELRDALVAARVPERKLPGWLAAGAVLVPLGIVALALSGRSPKPAVAPQAVAETTSVRTPTAAPAAIASERPTVENAPSAVPPTSATPIPAQTARGTSVPRTRVDVPKPRASEAPPVAAPSSRPDVRAETAERH